MKDQLATKHQLFIDEVCEAMRNNAFKIGFDKAQLPQFSWQSLCVTLVKDPANGAQCLSGSWRDKNGYTIGSFQVNGDGSFFAEHDLVLPHPTDKRWFVEAMTAWGNNQKILTEPRLLAAV